MEERVYCVYKHTSPSGKVYIGITKKKPIYRWANGRGYKTSPHFWNAIQKYGWDSFSHEILIDGLSEEDACQAEKRFISEYNSTDRAFGYNEKTGGQKGSVLNEEAKKRLSEKLKKFYETHPEEREKISKRVNGFRHTDEAKVKMSEAAKNRHYSLTEEWKRKIGEANKKKLTEDNQLYEDTCARCRANGAAASKAVVQLDFDGNCVQSFANAHEAERKTGIRNGNIGRCCRGRAKSAGGYKWQYAIEYNGGREIA